MVKVKCFGIVFRNARGIFQAGENVEGHLLLELTKPLKVRCIKVYVQGRAKAHWEVRHGKSTTHYRGNEVYIETTFTVLGQDQSETTLPVGTNTYPFSFSLPGTLPSSFEGTRGYVRYFCKATLDRPWKFDESAKRAFTVIRQLDLNRVLDIRNPIRLNQGGDVSCCCCISGRVEAKLTLLQRGFVPGEIMHFHIEVDNKSNGEVTSVILSLKQLVTYIGISDALFSSGRPKMHPKVENFALYTHNERLRGNQTFHINEGRAIPSLPPSLLIGCEIIDIRYFIKLEVNPDWGSSFDMENEITIGTVPLQQGQPSAVVSDQPLPMMSPASLSEPTAPPMYSEAPPSYAESVSGRVLIRDENDDENTTGEMTWAPQYPYYYNWNQSAFGTTDPAQQPPAYGSIPTSATGTNPG